MKSMRKWLLGAAILILWSGDLRAETPPVLVLMHVTVVDATGAAAKFDQTALISDGKITSLGPAAGAKVPKGAQIVDARGKYLIPGLWDMHVHLAGVSADPSWSKQVLLPLLLANGIVGIRDMGGDLETLLAWKQSIEAGALPGPHIVASGPWLAGSGKKSPEQIPVSNEEEARAAVRDLKKRGADFIKILTMPSREAFFAVADEAKKQGLSFVGHVPAQITAAEASDAGMHSIEHIVYSAIAFDCSSKETELRQAALAAREKHDQKALAAIDMQAIDSYSPEKAAALWERFKKNETWAVPTLASIAAILPPRETPEQQAKDPGLEFIPENLRKQWDPRVADNQMSAGEVQWWTRQFANDYKLAGEMHRAGVMMLAGSDSLDRFVFPGESLHKELQLLQDAGFTPMEALQSATLDAARFLGGEKEFGTIAVGQRADLVLLEANPLENIGNTSKIVGIVRGGRYLDRAALDALLLRAKADAKAAKVN
jgi:imidazolonepropionase-like amidohydrolase